MKNKVTAYTPNAKNDSIIKNRKESKFYEQWSLVDLNTGKEVFIARFYGTRKTTHCCVWYHGCTSYTMGSGKAGGYGHHASEALSAAILDAGFELQNDVGQGVIRVAFDAIARFSGLRSKYVILTAHA